MSAPVVCTCGWQSRPAGPSLLEHLQTHPYVPTPAHTLLHKGQLGAGVQLTVKGWQYVDRMRAARAAR